jgi:hypothetical protein
VFDALTDSARRYGTRLALLAALGSVSCASAPEERGAVMVAVDTNVTPGRDFDRLRVSVYASTMTDVAPVSVREFRYGWDDARRVAAVLDGGAMPITLSVTATTASERERAVEVSAWKGDARVFLRTVSLVIPAVSPRALS